MRQAETGTVTGQFGFAMRPGGKGQALGGAADPLAQRDPQLGAPRDKAPPVALEAEARSLGALAGIDQAGKPAQFRVADIERAEMNLDHRHVVSLRHAAARPDRDWPKRA